MSALLAGAGALVVVGAIDVFAGARPARGVRGVALMALGAVLALAVSRPADAATWWMVLVAAVTLTGMVTVSGWLVGRLGRASPGADLDDDLR